jgi:hypothetical protein
MAYRFPPAFSVQANITLGADTQQQDAAARCLLRAGQRRG